MRATTLALALCISALVSAPHAQSRFGVVTGKVTDTAGAPIPGATVRLTGQGQTPLTTASGTPLETSPSPRSRPGPDCSYCHPPGVSIPRPRT